MPALERLSPTDAAAAATTMPIGASTWVPVPEGSDFPADNLAFGAVRDRGADPGAAPRVVVRVGDHVIDVAAAGIAPELTRAPNLDRLLSSGRFGEVRGRVGELVSGTERPDLLTPISDVTASMPFTVADYVDFFASIHHATNLGRILRPGTEPLAANWRHLPIGYHGRSGTVVVSGTPVRRPVGMIPDPNGDPRFEPTAALDFELELAFVVGGPPTSGIAPDDVDRHVVGAVLLNDWSARDIQAFENQPLGPFLGKSFATTISPWVVPLDALRPHLVEPPRQEPQPAPHLRADRPWGLDLRLRAEINDSIVTDVGFAGTYWTFAQQLAHLTSNGASTRPGDLFAAGTVSGPGEGEAGSLIERTWGGSRPIHLDDGETRRYLEDGDTVRLTGWCGGDDGTPRVGFGESVGTIEPARRQRTGELLDHGRIGG
jgi:fumarylacetoacetase